MCSVADSNETSGCDRYERANMIKWEKHSSSKLGRIAQCGDRIVDL